MDALDQERVRLDSRNANLTGNDMGGILQQPNAVNQMPAPQRESYNPPEPQMPHQEHQPVETYNSMAHQAPPVANDYSHSRPADIGYDAPAPQVIFPLEISFKLF